MKKILPIIFVFIISLNIYAQIPYPELIEVIKPSVVGIEAYDDTLITLPNGNFKKYQSYGSGVLIAPDSIHVYALTNEHVVAIKDTNGKTIRYAKNIIVSINVKNIGAFPCKGEIFKVDEKRDLVALRWYFPKDFKDKMIVKAMGFTTWEDESNLKEGESVLYSGFPLKMGRGQKNSPLTRTGIISQLIPGHQTFLIDAFVQPGYSGSPVFVLRRKKNVFPDQWFYRFIGLCRAYPYDFNPVYREVKFSEIPGVFVIENPGFSEVVGVSAIKQLFK